MSVFQGQGVSAAEYAVLFVSDVQSSPLAPAASSLPFSRYLWTPDALRAYLTQARQELAARLVEKVYAGSEDGRPSKWWLAFTKRRFMGKSLS